MRGRATKFTATGAIATGDTFIQQLILSPGTAIAAVDIKEGGTGGTVVLSLQAGANANSVPFGPLQIKDPFVSAISGAGASLTVVM